MGHTSLRARVIGWLTALSGALLVLSTLPRVPERLAHAYRYVPLPLRVSGRVVTMLVGLLLLFLAGQLGRRKHRAWQVAVVLFSVTIVANLARLDRPLSAGLSAAMLRAAADQPPATSGAARPADAVPVRPLPAALLRGRVPLRPGLHLRPAQPRRPVAHARPQHRRHPQRPGRAPRPLRLPQRVHRTCLPRLAAGRRGGGPGRRPGPAVPPHRGPSPAGGGRLGARQPPGPHLRHRHAGLLRPARRQELLLLVRRRGDDRLHLHRPLRPGLG